MKQQMRGLTLWQPRASYIANGMKRYETRDWFHGYRGPVAIHAGKRIIQDEALPDLGYPLPYGAIIACAVIADCVPVEELWDLDDAERRLGDYAPGRYAWRLTDIVKLDEPIPYKGMLGLWTVDRSLAHELLLEMNRKLA